MAQQHPITAVTRQRIFDFLSMEQVAWAGRLEEAVFLKRLYPLRDLPSGDRRYSNAEGDINQHRLNNLDWEDDWVFSDDRFGLVDGEPELLLAFLAEMLHPVVRSDAEEVARLLKVINSYLAGDGYELAQVSAISGLPVYGGRRRGSFHGSSPELNLQTRPLLTDPAVLQQHLTRIRAGIADDPAAAIGSSKELVESLLKIILERSGEPYAHGEDMPALYKKVAALLGLDAGSIPDSARGSEAVRKILRTLGTTVQGLAELRNALGTGHGRTAPSPALARHARLALNSTVTITEFLLDTWQDRVDRNLLTLSN
ncbi:abortive infection family protein [Catellatospora citrea]|uniref:abortive infection family protein n=1 Tax=Catellatospora citrea TaxID=53366 RepID=UPI003402B859